MLEIKFKTNSSIQSKRLISHFFDRNLNNSSIEDIVVILASVAYQRIVKAS